MCLMPVKLSSRIPLPSAKKWKPEPVSLEGEARMAAYFAYHAKPQSWIKQYGGARWSPELSGWHLLARHENPKNFLGNAAQPSSDVGHLVSTFLWYQQSSRYSENSIQTDLAGLKAFWDSFPGKEPKDVTNQEAVSFFKDYAYRRKLSNSWQHSVIDSL